MLTLKSIVIATGTMRRLPCTERNGQRPSACEVRCTNLLAAYFLRIVRATLELANAKQVRLS
jgi:hypothetical protein